ncbi:hypothetical protein B0H67DRAFT_360456 [Lasiosphaeris hirsuta]|uniref:Uncharacterized protein n=1 Tax=Lasiosphaeris hirsuta TaxID=260670 RepID=A0AA40DL49_9PEZI|nr:hypothetical protein B0H67DRAFT_360456 [Lasiosphaeris hirsuta]
MVSRAISRAPTPGSYQSDKSRKREYLAVMDSPAGLSLRGRPSLCYRRGRRPRSTNKKLIVPGRVTVRPVMKRANEPDPPAMAAHSRSGVPPVAAVGIASEGPAGKGRSKGMITNAEKPWGDRVWQRQRGRDVSSLSQWRLMGRGCANGAMQARASERDNASKPSCTSRAFAAPHPLHDRWVREETGATITMCGYGEM